MKRWHTQFFDTLKMLLFTIASASALLLSLIGIEWFWGRFMGGPMELHIDKGNAASLMGSLAEVMAAVLGLSLTVVAIVVQLASQRYSAKIAELFMNDPLNRLFAGFMVTSSIYIVLIASLGERLMPVLAFWGGIILIVLNLGLLLPYFRHVFSFLQPQNIIRQIEQTARVAITQAIARNMPEHLLQSNRSRVATAVDRIADICLSAINQSDRNLSLNSVRTLERFVLNYLDKKRYLPPSWSHVSNEMFVGISEEFRREIANTNTWIEAHVMMEFEHILRLHPQLNEVLTQIASSTRDIGQTALACQDKEVLDLCVRFFNTFIRHALNARNVRGIYNILYQYRQLSEHIMAAQPETCRRIVDRLVYYGRLFNELGLPFATVTAAHDVQALCKLAYTLEGIDVNPLLDLFLLLDQPSEGKSEELALLGVRKAQTLLGAFFLSQGEKSLAQRIQLDMKEEKQSRVQEIYDTLLNTEERRFWEITDRAIDFDYVEPELRPYIEELLAPLIDTSVLPKSL
jgi:hypothetical protein